MRKLFFISSFLILQILNAQIDPNGVLILNSGTTAEINAISPQAGALVYDTDTNKTYVYDGTSWEIASGANENWTKSGNNQYSALSGNVGIGTNNPNYKLSIASSTNGAVWQQFSNTDTGDTSVDGFYLGIGSNEDAYVWNAENTALRFFTNNTEKMTISNTGNIGIGTTSPGAKLDIKNGHINVSGNYGMSFGSWGNNNADTSPDAQLVLDGTHNGGYNLGTKLLIRGNDNETNTTAISVIDENSNELFNIKTFPINFGTTYFKGNVGIGTTTPSTKLEVAGQIKITGGNPGVDKILTSDANGLATWQDVSSATSNSILIDGKDQTMFGNAGTTGNCIVSHGIATFFTNVNNNNYMHIKLPYRIDTHNRMYHIKATGYRYGASKVIDITWAGYCYRNGSALLNTSNTNSGDSQFNITQYVGSDNHIYLRFQGTTGSNYYQSFRIDSMNVGNGSVLVEGDIQIISSASANL